MAALVSASKDGGFFSGILECFGVEPVRGSSARRGAQAMLELTTWAERGYDLAITPDGPRGPCYVVPMASWLRPVDRPAHHSRSPTIWAGKFGSKAGTASRFPCPFPAAKWLSPSPSACPREATDAEREALRQRLEKAMRDMTRD